MRPNMSRGRKWPQGAAASEAGDAPPEQPWAMPWRRQRGIAAEE